ncbi:lysophospholipid acyltransferase family protein [Aquibacillus kalidii]|uniref:lysophospholipid acyltransferase family protein n=1 Tax=Aquibacillus kalidii TaxID=2762597 RepID=UPI001647CB9D|nr:lysophospholipid acyltransferase family protein [Aquibacillus kalidii]
MKSLIVYGYAVLLVLNSIPNLVRAKRKEKTNDKHKYEEIFETPKMVSQKVLAKTGSSVTVVGNEKLPEGPVLFVANHQGLFDILVLLGYVGKPIGFIAKAEIKKIPIISNWMEMLHCVFINRANRREAIQVIRQGTSHLQNGHSMVIFPEGTRSRNNHVGEFKAGSLQLGMKAKVPIVPVAINGTYKILEENEGRISPASVSIEICDPFLPEYYQGKKSQELAKDLQLAVEKALLQLDDQAS